MDEQFDNDLVEATDLLVADAEACNRVRRSLKDVRENRASGNKEIVQYAAVYAAMNEEFRMKKVGVESLRRAA